MKKKSRVKRAGSKVAKLFTKIINVRTWFDWERVRSLSLYLFNGIRRFFIPEQVGATESFEEAVARLNLTERDLILKQKALFRLSIIMVVVAASLFCYATYQLLYGSYHATVLSLVVMCIALVLAFRYHFWYFQIKHRKLGCSIQEWYRQGFLGEKK